MVIAEIIEQPFKYYMHAGFNLNLDTNIYALKIDKIPS